MKLDNAAINGFFRKDERCFEGVYLATYRLLYHVAFGYLHHEEDSREAVMETYAKALESRFERKGSFKAWLVRICVNLCLDRLKKEKPEPLEEEEHPQTEGYSDLLELTKKTLNPEEYEVLVYRIYGNAEFHEIAEMLSLPSASSARGIFHRAKKKCQIALKEYR